MPRQVAHKVWISDIVRGNFVKQEGFNPNYVEIKNCKVSRVNIIATVVSKFISEDGNYGALTLDDGTETIRVKAFGPDVSRIKKTQIGWIIKFVGKLKKYEDEVYVSPEVVRRITDPNWLIVRRLELGKPEPFKPSKVELTKSDEERGKPLQEDISTKSKDITVEKISEEVVEEESIDAKILKLVKSLDKGEGAELTEIINKSNLDEEDAKNMIVGLLKSGEIFEPRKGRLKALE